MNRERENKEKQTDQAAGDRGRGRPEARSELLDVQGAGFRPEHAHAAPPWRTVIVGQETLLRDLLAKAIRVDESRDRPAPEPKSSLHRDLSVSDHAQTWNWKSGGAD